MCKAKVHSESHMAVAAASGATEAVVADMLVFDAEYANNNNIRCQHHRHFPVGQVGSCAPSRFMGSISLVANAEPKPHVALTKQYA